MVFSPPYSGTFAYKGIIPSATMNALNTALPKALDKTGDKVADGGGISGQVDIKSGGSIVAQAGGTIALTGATLLTDNSTTVHLNVNSGSDVTVKAGGVVQAQTAGGITTSVAGGIATTTAGGIVSGVAGGIALTGGAGDWPTFPARTRSVPYDCTPYILSSGWSFGTFGNLIAPATTQSITLKLPRPHIGAQLASVTLSFSVSNHSASISSLVMPTVDVRYQAFTGGSAPVFNNNSISGGPQSMTNPGTAANWYLGGATQSFTVSCSNFAVTNDRYFYVVVTDENGTGSVAGNVYFGLTANFANITNLSFE